MKKHYNPRSALFLKQISSAIIVGMLLTGVIGEFPHVSTSHAGSNGLQRANATVAGAVPSPVSTSHAGSNGQGANVIAAGTTQTPVLFVHGIHGGSGSASCTDSYWKQTIGFLKGKGFVDSQLDTIGYYKYDSNCSNYLNPTVYDSRQPNPDLAIKCGGYLDGTLAEQIGTTDDSIKHLACEFAWYIYDKYSQYGTNVEIVPYSMGGLVTRYALQAVQEQLQGFPAWLDVSDVVNLDTPHGGSNPIKLAVACFGIAGLLHLSLCRQGKQMVTSNEFLQEIAQVQNPQGRGGTRWTLFGVANSPFGGIPCDAITADSSLYMDGAVKVVYDHCYQHAGNLRPWDTPILGDANLNMDATVYYCDPSRVSNCTKENAPYYTRWDKLNRQFPHPLHAMWLALTHQPLTSV